MSARYTTAATAWNGGDGRTLPGQRQASLQWVTAAPQSLGYRRRAARLDRSPCRPAPRRTVLTGTRHRTQRPLSGSCPGRVVAIRPVWSTVARGPLNDFAALTPAGLLS